MIRYALACQDGHEFESWFQSGDAYEKLRAANMVSCAICGSTEVEKRIMAPSLTKPAEPGTAPDLRKPASVAEQALQELRQKIEAGSEDVGRNFVSEARAIHDGAAPDRPIRGEARLKDAKALIDDGIPVAPLPFIPDRQSN